MIDAILPEFERLLARVSPLKQVRTAERRLAAQKIWLAIAESGFLDAMITESKGGAGLCFADIGRLIQTVGAHLVPAPIGESIVARALAVEADLPCPGDPITLVTPTSVGQGFSARSVAFGMVATHALVELPDQLVLSPLASTARVSPGTSATLSADLHWERAPEGATLERPPGGLRPIAAVIRANLIAGACHRLVEMTVQYAAERRQFGKPIGKQQAIQQQLAQMAEQSALTLMASQIGTAEFPPMIGAAAIAKQISSVAAAKVAAIAHAVHGAIGFTEEFDLQLYTRRLGEWRRADGTESYWAGILGRQRLGRIDI